MNISDIRNRLHQYLIESEDMYWQNWVGLQDEIDIVGLYSKYQDIFSRKSIETVQSLLRTETDPDLVHRYRSLLGQLTLSRMESITADLQQAVLKKESETTVTWESETIALRSFGVRIFNESDPERRKQMSALRENTVHSELNPIRKDIIGNLLTAISDLGYDNYISLCNETQNRDLASFAKQMRQFLKKSQSVFEKYLDIYFQNETGAPRTETTHFSDLTAVLRSSKYDPYFPGDRLVPVLNQSMAAMGFNLDKIHFDLEDRPKKKQRPCVSAVNPPEDVRLTVYPMGGFEDYAGLLHETGHAIHFIHEIPDLDFEFKYWGDRGFTEGTAYLFQHMTMNETWLKDVIGLEDPGEFIRFNAFLNIYRFRRLIGQFLYQIELFTSDSQEHLQDRYRINMEDTHGVKFDTSGYLHFDLEFYSAGYLRARLFEVQLREYLVQTFGPAWWNTQKTGTYLQSLYRYGRKLRADDVVRHLGFDSLDTDLYLERQLAILNRK